MAHTDFNIAFGPPVDTMIDTFLTEVGFGFNPGQVKRAIKRDVMRLNARSDAQLALFGITRDQIPAYAARHVLPDHAPTPRYAA